MVSASLYIIFRSAWNHARLRLRRLREPRYLLGAIAGAAYFYFSLFRFRSGGSRAGRRNPPPIAESFSALAGAGTTLVALLLAVGAALSWLMPAGGGLFEFSKAEVQFLFPAPVQRRQILIHRLMRSQLGLLFASIVSAAIFPRGSGAGRVRFALAMWLLLVTARLFSTAVVLARPQLTAPGRRARLMARVPLVLTAGVCASIVFALTREFVRMPDVRLVDLIARMDALARTGITDVLLSPFLAIAQPLFATGWSSFFAALPGALLVFGVVAAWVLVSDEAFSDAADAAVEGQDKRSAAPATRYRVRSAGFSLAATGRPEAAFFWKAATETARLVNSRVLLRFLLPLAVLAAAVTVSGAFPRGVAEILAVLALVSIGFSIFMGPQILRGDLREDLQHVAQLKTWPVAPASVIRGELLWPVSLLTVIVWGIVLVAALLAPSAFPGLPATWRAALAAAAVLAAPGLVAAQYVIHNASALMFPAWVTFGSQRPRGFDAMGQRLILLAGTWFALVLMALPGVVAAGIVWFLLARTLGPLALIPSALVFSTALLAESVLATEALGPVYDRVDFTDIERGE